jgi:hypothetical protein
MRYRVVGHDRGRYVAGNELESNQDREAREHQQSESRAHAALEVAAKRDWNDPGLWGG